jgi:hypothetical protein
MNLDEGKLQHEGARDKKFSEKGQGEPEQNWLSQVVLSDQDMGGWTSLML